MKKVFYSVFVFAAFAACKGNGSNFTVTGKITSPPSDSVFLEELSYNSADTKVIDSAKIEKDGTYKLKGKSEQQNLYVVGFKDNPAVILVNDAGDIKINFDPNGFHYPDVSGSNATEDLYKFIKNFWEKDSIISSTYHQLDTISEAQANDTVFMKNVRDQYTSQLMDLGGVVKNFINRSNDPAAICFALDKAKGAVAPQELSNIIDNVSKKFPKHTGIQAFKTAMTAQAGSSPENAPYGLLNQEAPDLTMPGANGKNISISNYRGKYLLVDFWASWCAPCRQENPNVVAAYNKFKGKNFDILGVSLDDDKAAWLKAIKDDHLAWSHMSDLQSPSSAASLYQFNGIPFNVLIDPSGKIIASGLRGPELEQKLEEVLQ